MGSIVVQIAPTIGVEFLTLFLFKPAPTATICLCDRTDLSVQCSVIQKLNELNAKLGLDRK